MTPRRPGLAALPVVLTAGLAAAAPPPATPDANSGTTAAPGSDTGRLGEILRSLREAAEQASSSLWWNWREHRPPTGRTGARWASLTRRAREEYRVYSDRSATMSEPEASGSGRIQRVSNAARVSPQASSVAQTAPSRQGPVFSQPGDWTHAEAAVVIGSQLVDQDLGFSRNIFQTVSAEAEDVGFGQHLGARGAFFVNRYLGAEAGFTRTTTDFEFSVTDEEAGITIFPEPLEQVSQEASVSAVLQWPRAAVTPYGVVGYAWRTSEVEGAEPFESGAVVVGIGIKVPFPGSPVLLAFDYRRIEFRDEEADALRLAQGGVGSPTVSALTLGVVVRLNVNR